MLALEYVISPPSSHREDPATSVSACITPPPVHDSAVAKRQPLCRRISARSMTTFVSFMVWTCLRGFRTISV